MKTLFSVFLLLALACVAVAQKEASVSDDELVDRVRLALVSDTTVQGGGIDVTVQQGVVTLKGRVTTDKAKEKAERLTKKVKGVKSVENKLVVSKT